MAMQNMPAWRVISQSETNRTDAAGHFVSGVLVYYTTANGVSGSVFIPDSQYNPDTVKARINERVAQHNVVGGLQG